MDIWYSFDLKSSGLKLKYVWVVEFQDNGNAHLHILINQFLPIEVLRKLWVHVGGLSAFCFEHFLPWIHKIMLAYQEQEDSKNPLFGRKINGFSEGYYKKKLN